MSTVPSIFTLTPGIDVVRGTPAPDTLQVAPGTLNSGDDIDLGDGADAIGFTAGGSYDLTAPARLAGVEFVLGSDGAEIVVVNQARLAGLQSIDLGGGNNQIQIAFDGQPIDFSALTVLNAAIRGTASNDHIVGTRGDDRIIAAGGTADYIDGHNGRDTVVTDLFFAQFTEVPPNPAELRIEGLRVFDGNGGRLNLRHAERVELRDGVVLLDQGANGTEAYRLVHAAFGSMPLEGTIVSVRDLLDKGLAPTDITRALMNSLPFERAYGTAQTDAQFVDALYRVVLNRAADEGGRAVQIDALAHGVSRAALLTAFADTAEHVAVLGRAATNDFLFVGEVGIA
jgi:hypothetical protein